MVKLFLSLVLLAAVVLDITYVEGSMWSESIDACIIGHNVIQGDANSVEDCQESCMIWNDNENKPPCRSIEYWDYYKSCTLNSATSAYQNYTEPCIVNGWVYSEILDNIPNGKSWQGYPGQPGSPLDIPYGKSWQGYPGQPGSATHTVPA